MVKSFCVCVCARFLYSMERNQWAGEFFTTSGAGETLQVGRWDVKGGFWWSGQPSMWPLSAALPTINPFGKLSGSDLSSFLVQGQVFNRMQTERLFSFFNHDCVFLSHAQMAAVAWRLETDACDPKCTDPHKDFSDRPLVSVLQLSSVGTVSDKGRQQRIRKKCSRTAQIMPGTGDLLD